MCLFAIGDVSQKRSVIVIFIGVDVIGCPSFSSPFLVMSVEFWVSFQAHLCSVFSKIKVLLSNIELLNVAFLNSSLSCTSSLLEHIGSSEVSQHIG